MTTGKEIILNNCKNVSLDRVDHFQDCEDIKHILMQDNYDEHDLSYHCITSFIPKDFKGFIELCVTNPIVHCDVHPGCHQGDRIVEEKSKQCRVCWKNALVQEFSFKGDM
jgi:hypothetical protein